MKKLLISIYTFILFIFSFLPIYATNEEYVRDDYGLMDSSAISELNEAAKAYSLEHEVGIYIRVYPSIPNDIDPAKYAEQVYAEEGLGENTDGNMILLILSMDNRQYRYVAHGDKANSAFTDYGKQELDAYVVPPLRENQYHEGFNQFIEQCDRYLDLYEEGTPIDIPIIDQQKREETANALKTGATLGLPPLVSILTMLGLKARNKNVALATKATGYIPKDGIHITTQRDRFSHSTETSIYSPINNDRSSGGGGGTTIKSGVFSSHGGAF